MDRSFVVLVAALSTLAGCASPPVGAEAVGGPPLTVEGWFAGETHGYGVLDQGGRTTERFTVKMEGRPSPAGFQLYERFVHPDGFTWARTWTLTRRPGQSDTATYDGTAETVVGTGRIDVRGDTLRMRFVADQPQRDGSIRLRFDQRFTRLQDDVVLDRAVVSKFGVPVGRITMTLVKPGADHPVADSIRSMSSSDRPK